MSLLLPNTDDGCNTSDVSGLTTGLLIETVTNSGQYEQISPRWRRAKYAIALLIVTAGRKKTTPTSSHHNLHAAAADDDDQVIQAPYAPLPSTPPPSPSLSAASATAASDHEKLSEALIRSSSSSSAQPPSLPGGRRHVIDIPLQEVLPKNVARIVRDKDIISLQRLGGVDAVLPLLTSHLHDQVAAVHVDGGHQHQPQPPWESTKPVRARGFFYFLWNACNKYAIFTLLLTAVPSFAVEFTEQGVKTGWHDGAAILAAVFLLVSVPSVGNYLHERKLVRERSKLVVNVERSNGEPRKVTISGVVVGDIAHLKEGDLVPADGLFIDGENFVLDEVLSPKIDRVENPFVLSGSKVVQGRGRIFVVSVGVNTALADVLSLVTHDDLNDEKTVLQALMDKPYVWMDYLSLGGAILIAVLVLIRVVIFRKHDNYNDRPELKGEVSRLTNILEKIFFKLQGRVPTLSSVLATVVIGIQHGMPLAITLALVQWKKKMVRNQADPQNQSACVTMDRVTVMCFGTTGELMCKQMEVKEFWIGEKDLSNEGVSETNQVVLEALHQGISATSTNDFITSWLNRWGAEIELLDQEFDILEQRKLSSDEKCSRTSVRKIKNDQQVHEWHSNGDASTIVDLCSHYYDNRGESHIMGNQKRIFKQVVKNMEEKGLRSIAYAYKEAEVQELSEDGLYLLALVGLRRPYQEELESAVGALRNAGKKMKLVSGDELSTVRARALELGIITPGSSDMALEGEAFRRLNSMERSSKVDLITVMGSCLPKDIFLLAKSLKKKGHIVAYYGGLTTSDAPILKEADLGITEDIWSTEMARENADIIIKDGCLFTSILESGACAYHNILKFSQLELTACISGLLITVVATMHSGESPLTAIHLIWVYLIMCLLGGLMMVMEFKGLELLTQTPEQRTQLFITKVIWRNIAIQVSYQASVFLILHFMGNVVPSMDEGVRNTMIFNTFALCQVVHLFNVIGLEKKEVLEVVRHSSWFLMALSAVLVMQVVIVEFGEELATGMKLNAVQWAVCSFLAALSWGSDWAINSLSDGLRSCSSALTVNSQQGFSDVTERRRLYISLLPIWVFFIILSVSFYYHLDDIAQLANINQSI